jgi:hypothetical protein
VTRRVEHLEIHSLDLQPVAIGHPHGDHIDAALVTHHGDAMGTIAQRSEPGNVVGMQMRIDRFHETQIELTQKLQIAIDLLDHRVDDERLAATAAGEQIAVGAGDRIEQLAEYHAICPTAAARYERGCGTMRM